jgi:hypothetical protein
MITLRVGLHWFLNLFIIYTEQAWSALVENLATQIIMNPFFLYINNTGFILFRLLAIFKMLKLFILVLFIILKGLIILLDTNIAII